MEFGASILGAETPVDVSLGDVASDLIGVDGDGQCHVVAVASPKTVSTQHAELDLRHVEPTGVLGGSGAFYGDQLSMPLVGRVKHLVGQDRILSRRAEVPTARVPVGIKAVVGGGRL